MQKIIVLMAVFIMLTCGEKKKAKEVVIVEENLLSLLKIRYERYVELQPSVQDSHGFIETEHCDSLLFSGLAGIAVPVDIEAARDETGAWHRRPLDKPCYPDHSASTISRDMLMGLLWYVWKNKRLDLAEDLYSYGESKDWIMGEGDLTRLYFTPKLQATLAELIFRLGGDNKQVVRAIPQLATTKTDGFAAHLDVLHILLRADMTKNMEEMEVITHHFNRVPDNALFSYAYHKYYDGNQTDTLKNLLKIRYFPADRLPSDCDRYEPWLWQRDQGVDWLADDNCSLKIHSGGDFLFVAKLLLEDLGQ